MLRLTISILLGFRVISAHADYQVIPLSFPSGIKGLTTSMNESMQVNVLNDAVTTLVEINSQSSARNEPDKVESAKGVGEFVLALSRAPESFITNPNDNTNGRQRLFLSGECSIFSETTETLSFDASGRSGDIPVNQPPLEVYCHEGDHAPLELQPKPPTFQFHYKLQAMTDSGLLKIN